MKKREKGNKAIIYCRVSTAEQVKGTSLATQEAACRDYARREGMGVVRVFLDEGESAKTVDRPEFLKALVFCEDKENPIDFFLVYKVDRFARSREDHMWARTRLGRHGTELRSATEPVDATPEGGLMEGILSSVAEYDNAIRSVRVKMGMGRRASEGKWLWTAPAGYMRPREGSNIMPCPKAAPFVRRAFSEFSKGGHSVRSLAKLMNSWRYTTSRGGRWTGQAVLKMLRNPIYTGIIRTNGNDYPGLFEPIIYRGIYGRCQDILDGKSFTAVPRILDNPQFPLRRLIVCTECGKALTGSSPRSRSGKRYPYYHHYSKGCSLARNIPIYELEDIFTQYLAQIAPEGRFGRLFARIVRDVWQERTTNARKANAEVDRNVARLHQERQRVYDLHREGVYTNEDFLTQKNVIEERIADANVNRMQELHGSLDLNAAMTHCLLLWNQLAEVWNKADHEARLALQGIIFKKTISYDGRSLGTAELPLIFQLKKTFRGEKSLVVVPRGFEPRGARVIHPQRKKQ